MKKILLSAFAVALGSATPTLAAFVNGSFEDADLSAWSYRWGKTSYSTDTSRWSDIEGHDWTVGIQWNGHHKWPGVTDGGDLSTLKAMSVTQTEGANPYMSSYANPVDGSRQLIVNFKPGIGDVAGAGNYDVTQFAQKARVEATDVGPDGLTYNVYVKWGAIVENPVGHDPENQPGFIVRVGIKPLNGTKWDYETEFHTGDLQTNNGWVKTPTNRDGTNMYAKRANFKKEVHLHDSISIEMAVIDCGHSAHGAFAYLDQVGFVEPPQDSGDTIGMPCIYGTDSLLIGSRVKVAGDFGSGKGILLEADAIDTGNGWAMGNVYMRDRSKIVGNITYKGNLVKWNNTAITGTAKKDAKLVIAGIVPKVVTPGTTNVYAYYGNTVNLAPGNYGEVVSYGGSFKLSAGTYNVRSFVMYQGNGTLVLDNSNGPINVNVAGNLEKFDVKESVITATNDEYVANPVKYYVTGDVKLYSGKNHIWGSFDAPNGTITLDSREIGGYIHGKRVIVNSDAKSTCREAPKSF